MSFWDNEDVQEDPLQTALQKPDVTVDEVLAVENVLQELRISNQDLLTFLSKENSIFSICEWSMTLKNEKNPNYDKISRISTESLVVNKKYIEVLLQSAKFQEFLEGYLANSEDWDDGCCGHFNRVFLCMMSETKGSFFSRFPTLIESLKNHIHLLAVCELLSTLAEDYSKTTLSADILNTLALTAAGGSPHAWNCLYVLRRSLPAVVALNSPTMIQCLEKSARSLEKLVRVESFRLLASIRQEADAQIAQQIIETKVPSGEMNSQQGYALSCAVASPDDAFNILFKRPLHWSAANQMLEILLKLPIVELGKTVNRNNGLQRMQEAADKNDLAPQQLKIIAALSKPFGESPVFKEKISASLRTKAALIGSPFGGDVPQSFERNIKDLNGE